MSQQINNSYTESEVLTEINQTVDDNNNNSDCQNNAILTEPPPSTNLEISKTMEKNFDNIYARVLKQNQKPRIKRINTARFDYQLIVDKVDFLLKSKIYSIKNSRRTNISCLRKQIKTEIYTAGYMLSKESNKTTHSKPPNYIYIQRRKL